MADDGKGHRPRPSLAIDIPRRDSSSDLSDMPHVSPRLVAPRLAKILTSDPQTVVTPTLGKKSTSHPGVEFPQGGGFTAITTVDRPLSQQELSDDHSSRLAKWQTASSSGKPVGAQPTPKPSGKKVTFHGDLEYHPPGGIHSNYNPTLSDDVGGSYLRVKTTEPAKSEARYGRHGSFANDKTFKHGPLKRHEFGEPGKAETAPVRFGDSPPPSPRTARILTQQLYDAPQQFLSELATHKSYGEIAGTSPRSLRVPPNSPVDSPRSLSPRQPSVPPNSPVDSPLSSPRGPAPQHLPPMGHGGGGLRQRSNSTPLPMGRGKGKPL